MVKRIKSKNAFKAGEFQAASMSDIAFLLLVFFIVTTIFALEEGIPLILPARQSQVAKVKQKNIMEIKAYPDGSVVVEGENVGVGKDDTLYAKVTGIVAFRDRGRMGKFISVLPSE